MKELLINNMNLELRKFQKKYPAITSADMQTFLLGYQAAIDLLDNQSALLLEESIQMAKLSK